MPKSLNRKLLTSVYNAQEAREAVLGGARIVDSEDPKSALGNISPLKIMAIGSAVLDATRDLDVQLSTNIGEDQLIFRRTDEGRAIEKSSDEMAGKAAQAALGVAISMGTRVHPCNIIKVGLDGMPPDQLSGVLTEVVKTLRTTPEFRECQVMSVLFAQDLALWDERKLLPAVRRELVSLHEFSPTEEGGALAFDLREHAGDAFRAQLAATKSPAEALQALKGAGILPRTAQNPMVRVTELFPHHAGFESRDFKGASRDDKAPERASASDERRAKTSRNVIRAMVDLTADAGADAMMLDTSILSKVCNICLVDTSSEGFVNLSRFIIRDDLQQRGVLSLADLRFFVEYCHYRSITPNLAGSIESFQAQQLWASLPKLDQISTRGAASAAIKDPVQNEAVPDNRRRRVIVREFVRGLAPPEHGGVLNLPVAVVNNPAAQGDIAKLIEKLTSYRAERALPPLEVFSITRDGTATPYQPLEG